VAGPRARDCTLAQGRVTLDLADVSAPKAVIVLPAWPPADLAA